ncbi:MAG: insulinase family protein [Candidatus Aminicenantes bacterium]|nr:insulinase family protein [Candidatus Aminicenantes bacterium]
MKERGHPIKQLVLFALLAVLVWPQRLPAQPLTFEVFSLDNGLRVYYQFQPGTNLTTVVFHFLGGQALETPGQAGLAYLATRLMAEVTDEDRLSELLASGVNLSAGSRADFSAIQFEGLTRHFDRILGIVAAGLKNPLFSGPRIDRVRNSLKLEASQEACRLVDSALICLRRLSFPGSPYGQSLYGREADLRSISRKDINQFYDSIMNGGVLSILVITDLEKKSLQEILARHLSWIKSKTPLPGKRFQEANLPSEKAEARGCDHYQGPEGAAVALGYLFPGELAETYPAAYLLEKIIGEGPGSLIWNLRQESGLAYNLNSRLEILGGKIMFVCYLETEKDLAASSLTLLKQTFLRLSQQGLDPEAVARGKVIARNGYRRESFGRDNRLGFLSLVLAGSLPLEFFNNFLELLDKKSPDQLNELARATFSPDRAYEVVIVR